MESKKNKKQKKNSDGGGWNEWRGSKGTNLHLKNK